MSSRRFAQTAAFPRSNERGSIEAQSSSCFFFYREERFHVRMNVAQLKQAARILNVDLVIAFPRSNERGSIEARKLGRSLFGILLVSTFE